jgi:hypothetical protein
MSSKFKHCRVACESAGESESALAIPKLPVFCFRQEDAAHRDRSSGLNSICEEDTLDLPRLM